MTMTDPAPAGGLIAHLDDDAQRSELNAPTADLVADPPPARRQPGHLVEVFVEGAAEYPYRLRILNRDRIEYEKAQARHRDWPSEGKSFGLTFCTWAAARRTGRTDVSFDRWQQLLEDWNVLDEAAGADPTR